MVLESPKKVINIKNNLPKETNVLFKYQRKGKTVKFIDEGHYLINVVAENSIKKSKINLYVNGNKNTLITSKTNDNLLVIHEIIKIKVNDKIKIKNESNKHINILNFNLSKIA